MTTSVLAPYFATQVRAMPIVAALLRDRAFWPAPIAEVIRFGDADTLPVPGRPIVVPIPGPDARAPRPAPPRP
jgi:hypothetical protein